MYEDSFDDIAQDAGLHAWLSPQVLQRVGSLSLEGERGLLDLALSRLPPSMDQLRKLFITVEGADSAIILPLVFLDLDCIEMLWLEGCEIPWSSPIYSAQITYLHFRGNGRESPKTYQEFSDLIKRLPRLESLHLLNFIPTQSPATTINLPPCLRWLEFIVTRKTILLDGIAFLSNLPAPPSCTRQIQILNISSALAASSPFNTALRLMLSRIFALDHGGIIPRTLDIRSDMISVKSGDVPSQHVNKPIYSIPASAENTISLGPDTDDTAALLQCQTLTSLLQPVFHGLNRISFIGSAIRAIDEMNIWSVLQAAVDVKRVDIGLDPFELADAECSALLDVLRRAEDEGSILFPRLEVLVFHLSKEEINPEWINGILDVVRVRKERGVPLCEVFVPEYAAGWNVWDRIRGDVRVTAMEPF